MDEARPKVFASAVTQEINSIRHSAAPFPRRCSHIPLGLPSLIESISQQR